MRLKQWTALCALAAVMGGCADATLPSEPGNTVSVDTSRNASRYTDEGPQNPPPGAGPEWQEPTLLDVMAEVGFTNEPVSPDQNRPGNVRPSAYGIAHVHYLATHAAASIKIVVKQGTSTVAESEAEASEENVFPWVRELHATTQVQLSSPCGHSNHGTAKGSVKNQALISGSWFAWGGKSDTHSAEANQPACAQGAPGTNGGTPPDDGGVSAADCYWAREYVIYDDGSWEWLGGWFQICDDAMSRAPDVPTALDAGNANTNAMRAIPALTTNKKWLFRVIWDPKKKLPIRKTKP